MKVAFITGVTGQDGSFTAEYLCDKKEYTKVYGFVRRTSTTNTQNIDSLIQKSLTFSLLYGDITDIESVIGALKTILEEVPVYTVLEIYNFAAQSFVKMSFESPEFTAQVDAIGVLKLLEAVRILNIVKKTRLFQASTSEMFGKVQETPQNENTPFYPRSPYGVAKLYAYWIVKNYRESYNMFATNIISYNHESPRRNAQFVTRKISMAVAKIINNAQDCLYLGNIDSKRDWGHSDEYCKAIYLAMQHHKPDDFVIATGENHSVREFINIAFERVHKTVVWEGNGIDEVGKIDNIPRVRISKKFYRPCEVDELLGDPSKAIKELGWKPKNDFRALVYEMVDHDLSLFQQNNNKFVNSNDRV